MNLRHTLFFLSLALLAFIIQGCASSSSGKVYTRDEARQESQIYYGIIQQVNNVTIEGESSALGTVAGGALGAGVGQAFGSGTGRTLTTIIGAVGGAYAGKATEEKLTTEDAQEIVVDLDNGETVSVVQESDVVFSAGERVRVLRARDGTSRVTY